MSSRGHTSLGSSTIVGLTGRLGIVRGFQANERAVFVHSFERAARNFAGEEDQRLEKKRGKGPVKEGRPKVLRCDARWCRPIPPVVHGPEHSDAGMYWLRGYSRIQYFRGTYSRALLPTLGLTDGVGPMEGDPGCSCSQSEKQTTPIPRNNLVIWQLESANETSLIPLLGCGASSKSLSQPQVTRRPRTRLPCLRGR